MFSEDNDDMAKQKAASSTKEPTDEDGFPLPETSQEEPKVSATTEMSKADAVRAAIAAGIDNPKSGVEYIKKKFGIELTTAVFSVTKSQDKKKAEDTGAAAKPKPTKKAHKPAISKAPAIRTAAPSSNSTLTLLRQVKELADTHGGDEIREILTLLGK